jgi:peptide/nickel transport system permease protein
MRYFIARLLALLLTVWASSLLAFVFLEAAPGDFLSDATLHPRLSEGTLQSLRAQYLLDQPLATKYLHWLKGVVQGDWGRSFARDLPVFPLVMGRAWRTVLLAGGAQVIAWTLALLVVGIGIQRPQGALDRVMAAIAAVLLSIPEIVLALVAVLLFSQFGAAASPEWPALVALVVAITPVVWRQAHGAMQRAAAEPYVDAARANSLPRRLVLTHYILPGAAPTLASLAGLSVGGLLSASLLVECVTAYPGLGPLMLDAVFARDLFVVVASVFLSTALWAGGSFLADLAGWLIDPRRRESA